MLEKLKRFDYFPKVSETVEIKKTTQGGFIFTFFAILMASLCLIEFYNLFLGDPYNEPYVEKPNINEKIRVNLNISVYEVPCEALSLDFQDITGTHFEDLQQTIYKLDLNEQGYIVDNNKFEVVKKFENKNFYPSHPVWEKLLTKSSDSCYGAELYVGQKCKTCQDVQKAYLQRGWPIPPLSYFTQCSNYKTTTARSLSEEHSLNFTEFKLEDLFKENSLPQFYLENTLFEMEDDLKKDHIFSFNVQRRSCETPQEVFLEFTYLDSAANTTQKALSKPIFFRSTYCQSAVPLKVGSVENGQLVLESFLFENGKLNINIENEELFRVSIIDNTPNSNKESPTALFKGGVRKIKGRMLHAEFYGFDDTRPTIVTQDEIDYFKKNVGKGCQIAGTMFISKVPGNFHISTHHKGLGLVYTGVNITARHKVHLLEFTKEEEKITLGKYTKATNYLDGKALSPQVGEDVQYYLKIVGSTYNGAIWGETKYYEYVAHEDITPSKAKNLILLEFKYEFDPISMRYVTGRESFGKFIISLLAIVGGIFATSIFIDRIFGK